MINCKKCGSPSAVEIQVAKGFQAIAESMRILGKMVDELRPPSLRMPDGRELVPEVAPAPLLTREEADAYAMGTTNPNLFEMHRDYLRALAVVDAAERLLSPPPHPAPVLQLEEDLDAALRAAGRLGGDR